jgi:4'-phosphopantetheinyl transferase
MDPESRPLSDENSIRLNPTRIMAFYACVDRALTRKHDAFMSMLDETERARAMAFHFEQDRFIFTAAHALGRSCLSCIAGTRNWRFRVDAFGKPEIFPLFGEPPLRFNLSHTRGMVACAISRGHAIGIDVEAVDRYISFLDIAREYFSDEECKHLNGVVSAAQPETFYRIWTLKEAMVKAIGQGLSLPLKDFAFRLDPLALNLALQSGENAADWHFESLAPSSEHVMALAVRHEQKTPIAVGWHRIDLDSLPYLKAAG